MTKEEQTEFASKLVYRIMADVYHDTTTDPSGYTIEKHHLSDYLGKLLKKVKRGDFILKEPPADFLFFNTKVEN